eukprot:CAMPEP_0185024904 /NCGR_PEP_ID=MMETSP1103-20130426/8071_1 /TAXON_ID=36769 /ORGANISM="Paraphysomonas bandaiensis, Strain Caron Lab Isolate" /LENGTH=303 /DNA_ID=CAMNT_0027557989 /DNA_START=61 /DNA_END=973 /DNA_ORIENTATION=-
MAYRIYVGNLPMDVKEREVEDLFYKYGRIRDIDLKTPSRPPAYAFVSFEYQEDADAAIRGRDGYDFDGDRLRVEYSKGSRGSDRGDFRRDNRGRGGGRRSDWRVIVTRLPRSASWQDLKDFMRRAGDVIYADVDSNGDGIVEYSNEDDMENAVRKLDDTEFKNPFDRSYVRVKFADRDATAAGADPGIATAGVAAETAEVVVEIAIGDHLAGIDQVPAVVVGRVAAVGAVEEERTAAEAPRGPGPSVYEMTVAAPPALPPGLLLGQSLVHLPLPEGVDKRKMDHLDDAALAAVQALRRRCFCG